MAVAEGDTVIYTGERIAFAGCEVDKDDRGQVVSKQATKAMVHFGGQPRPISVSLSKLKAAQAEPPRRGSCRSPSGAVITEWLCDDCLVPLPDAQVVARALTKEGHVCVADLLRVSDAEWPRLVPQAGTLRRIRAALSQVSTSTSMSTNTGGSSSSNARASSTAEADGEASMQSATQFLKSRNKKDERASGASPMTSAVSLKTASSSSSAKRAETLKVIAEQEDSGEFAPTKSSTITGTKSHAEKKVKKARSAKANKARVENQAAGEERPHMAPTTATLSEGSRLGPPSRTKARPASARAQSAPSKDSPGPFARGQELAAATEGVPPERLRAMRHRALQAQMMGARQGGYPDQRPSSVSRPGGAAAGAPGR